MKRRTSGSELGRQVRLSVPVEGVQSNLFSLHARVKCDNVLIRLENLKPDSVQFKVQVQNFDSLMKFQKRDLGISDAES